MENFMININNRIDENRGREEPAFSAGSGMSFDVSSSEELNQAIQAGYPREQIVYNSGDISLEVTKMAVNHRIGRIIVYGTEELKMIEGVCREKSQKVNALLHIPSVGNNLIHEFITKVTVISISNCLKIQLYYLLFSEACFVPSTLTFSASIFIWILDFQIKNPVKT